MYWRKNICLKAGSASPFVRLVTDFKTVITKVFPDEFHLHTLDQLLSAIARLNPHVDMKKIVIGLMDRLSSYAQRESENTSNEDRLKAEEEAVVKMLQKVDLNNVSNDEPGIGTRHVSAADTNGTSQNQSLQNPDNSSAAAAAVNGYSAGTGTNPKVGGVLLFEIFYDQVVSLVKTRALPIQDTMALLTSLVNLAL